MVISGRLTVRAPVGEGPSGDNAVAGEKRLSRDAMLCGALLFALLQSAEVELADEQPVSAVTFGCAG